MYILIEQTFGMIGHLALIIIVGTIIMHGTGDGILGTDIDGIVIAGTTLIIGMKDIGSAMIIGDIKLMIMHGIIEIILT
jgi:hypothetical protein|tara:strand:- start:889 stop:1125 length:237 start_codon:yes stop_codon:yes gene_type:complete